MQSKAICVIIWRELLHQVFYSIFIIDVSRVDAENLFKREKKLLS